MLGGRNIKVYPLRIWIKEISDDNKKEFICFHLYNNMQRSIVLLDIVTSHEILFQSVAILIPLNTSTKEILAHRRKLFWFPQQDYF